MAPNLPDSLPLETLEIDTQAEAQNIKKPGEAQILDTDISFSNESSEEEEFDWEKGNELNSKAEEKIEVKSGGRVWLVFMKLSRPIRVFLIASLRVGVLVMPLIVVHFRFSNTPVKV
ncbi:hypothetical protein H1R20_g2390, partial [Candolleomyces eurysporus]